MITFKMIDLNGDGSVIYEVYEKFWILFLQMYGEMFDYKINIDD
jgi:hypothetical protein